MKPHYALSNFYPEDDRNGFLFHNHGLGHGIHFPTSEHFLHFQKLSPAAKSKNLKAWRGEQSPGNILIDVRDKYSRFYIPLEDYSDSIKTGGSFDPTKWDTLSLQVQMEINLAKYQQSAGFRAAIDESIELGQSFTDGLGTATIIEDTASASRTKKIWGTGADGEGTNVLGNSQTAFANWVVSEQTKGRDITHLQPTSAFQAAKRPLYLATKSQFMTRFQPTLVKDRLGAGTQDTYDLGSKKVNMIAIHPTASHQHGPADKAKLVPSTTTYVNSRGGNQRLVIKSGDIVGYEFRDDETKLWQKAANPKRFQSRVNRVF